MFKHSELYSISTNRGIHIYKWPRTLNFKPLGTQHPTSHLHKLSPGLLTSYFSKDLRNVGGQFLKVITVVYHIWRGWWPFHCPFWGFFVMLATAEPIFPALPHSKSPLMSLFFPHLNVPLGRNQVQLCGWNTCCWDHTELWIHGH